MPVIIFAGIRHFYYLDPFIDNISFKSSDSPAFVTIVPELHAYGIHYFGDYLLPSYWASLKNPWLEAEIVTYPPLPILIFKFFGLFEYRTGLLFFLAFMLCAMLAPLILTLRMKKNKNWIAVTLLVGACSGPLIITMDRGNIIGLMPLLYFGVVYLAHKKKWKSSSLLLAISIALKYYPVVLLVIFLKERQFWRIFITLLQSFILIIGLAFIFPGDKFEILVGLVKGAIPFLTQNESPFLCYNVSFTSGLAHIATMTGKSELALWIVRNSNLVSVLMTLVIAGILLLTKVSKRLQYLMAMSLTTILPSRIYSYSFNYALASLAILILLNAGVEARNSEVVKTRKISERIFTKDISNSLALFSLVLLLVPWPIAIPMTVESGCTTSIIGIVGVFSILILMLAVFVEKQSEKIESNVPSKSH